MLLYRLEVYTSRLFLECVVPSTAEELGGVPMAMCMMCLEGSTAVVPFPRVRRAAVKGPRPHACALVIKACLIEGVAQLPETGSVLAVDVAHLFHVTPLTQRSTAAAP